MADSLWLSVKVVSGSSVLFGSKIVSCSNEETFGNLISRLQEEQFSERRVEKVNIEDNKNRHEVQLDAPVSLCSREQFNCRSIVFHLTGSESDGAVPSTSSAFTVLMNSQKRILLPRKAIGESLRADQRLRNDVIDLLSSMNIGWSPDVVDTVGQQCIKAIVASLWYLDPHHDRFRDRSLAIPTCFASFKGYNDWKRKKEKCPQLRQPDLDKHVQALSSLLSQPWCYKPHFKPLQKELAGLVEVMKQYLSYLQKHNQSVKATHASPSPLRLVEENILLETRPSVPVCDPKYQQLQEKLASSIQCL